MSRVSVPGLSRFMRLLAVLVVGLLVVACAVPGPTHAPLALTGPGALGLDARPSAPMGERWWADWGDPHLTALVDMALQGHPSLALARARVARAEALAAVRGAAASPQVSLGADLAVQRYSENGHMTAPIAGSLRDTGTVRATLGWSPDLFGQQALDLASALDQARAAQADAALAATGLAAQLGRGYVALARLLAHREVGLRALAQREQLLQLVQARVTAGLDSQLELTLAQGAVPDARYQIEAIDEQIALARRQLAVLSGQPAQALDALAPALQQLRPETPPAALGTDLLGRRADVVAARWRVESALQDVALARTQFYPNLNIGAFVGLNALGLAQLLRAGSMELGITPALRLPLFDGDRLRHQLGARQAELDAAIAQYNGVLLDAVREAGDALGSDGSLKRQRTQQADVLTGAARTAQLARLRFDAGLGNYLAVLEAESPWLVQRRLGIDLLARQLDNQMLLIKALGGGWRDDTIPTRPASHAYRAGSPPNPKDVP